jgi:hypothetical protein
MLYIIAPILLLMVPGLQLESDALHIGVRGDTRWSYNRVHYGSIWRDMDG